LLSWKFGLALLLFFPLSAEKSVFKFQQFNILSPQIVAGQDY